MASSGNYKKKDIPDEQAFMPVVRRPSQGEKDMIAELEKLARM